MEHGSSNARWSMAWLQGLGNAQPAGGAVKIELFADDNEELQAAEVCDP
jgi:hypothetical protein